VAAPPRLQSLSPAEGSPAGGSRITLTGSGFTGPGELVVAFGDALASDIQVTGPGEATATLPQHTSLGQVDVTVANDNGLTVLADGFVYRSNVRVTSARPAIVRSAGGSPVTITGVGFTGAEGTTVVTFGGRPASSVQVMNDTTIVAMAPARGDIAPFAPVDVVVENANGVDTLHGQFRFAEPGLLFATSLQSPEGLKLWYVNPNTEAPPLELTTLRYQLNGLAIIPGKGLFGVSRRTSKPTLVAIDAATFEARPVAALGPPPPSTTQPPPLTGLLFSGDTLYAYGHRYSPYRAYKIHPETGVAVEVNGAATSHMYGSAALAAHDGKIYWLGDLTVDAPAPVPAPCTSCLHDLNPTTGAFTSTGVPVFGAPTAGMRSHGAASLGGKLYTIAFASSNGDSQLMSVDPTTGRLTLIKALPRYARGLTSTLDLF
jgi:hypothetical protein